MTSDELEAILHGRGEGEIGALNLLRQDPHLQWFQQDNLRAHLTGPVTTAIDNSGLRLLPWPARSPDYNPIENLWQVLKYKVGTIQAKQHIADEDELWRVTEACFNELRASFFQNLVLSMQNRISEAIKSLGEPINY